MDEASAQDNSYGMKPIGSYREADDQFQLNSRRTDESVKVKTSQATPNPNIDDIIQDGAVLNLALVTNHPRNNQKPPSGQARTRTIE